MQAIVKAYYYPDGELKHLREILFFYVRISYFNYKLNLVVIPFFLI